MQGPWTVYKPGTLQLPDATGCVDHIASPDVHIDNDRLEIRMFFHGVATDSGEQLSFFATSTDGLHFRASPKPIGSFYLRMVAWRNEWIGMPKGGLLYRSKTGIDDFKELTPSAFPMSNRQANSAGDVRHVALHCDGDNLEHILRTHIDLQTSDWRATESETILWPEMDWEGADIVPRASRAGASIRRENALRDPAVFVYINRTYLLYAIAGECGIAIGEIKKSAVGAY